MPRSKTRKPKTVTKTDAARRAPSRRQVSPGQAQSKPGQSRRTRLDARPMKFPGRLGGR